MTIFKQEDNGLTAQQNHAINLMCGVGTDRKLNNKQIAEQVGVSTVAFYSWKKKPEFNDAYLKLAAETSRQTLGAVKTWMDQAMANPKTKDSVKIEITKIQLKMAGEFKDVSESTVTVKNNQSVDDILKQLEV